MPNKLVIADSVKQLFPNLQIAVISGTLPEAPQDSPPLRTAIAQLRESALETLETESGRYEFLSQHPHVAAWRAAYSRFGVKAKRHPPTHEALAKRLLKTGEWPDINPITDIYLANQVEWLLPHGGYDTNYLSGSITLQTAQAGLEFTPLGSDQSEPVPEGEIIYTDDSRVLTRRWNYRDCDITRLRNDSTQFWLAIESPDSDIIEEAQLTGAASGLCDKLATLLNATVESQLVSTS